jgi:hypothetical protein
MEVVDLPRASERREGGRRTSAERAGIGHAVWTPGGAPMPDICSFLAMVARVLKRDGIVDQLVPEI